MPNKIPEIIIFASGGGSNAKAIYNYSLQHNTFKVAAIFCNNTKAAVIPWANENKIPMVVFTKQEFVDPTFLNSINSYNANLIVLAGFLLLVPQYLVGAYTNKIVNIHPALLPKYGGKGMYGHFVHEAVKANNETESGITIHIVNEKFDDGEILLQAKTELLDTDDANSIAAKVLQLEHVHFAKAIDSYLQKIIHQ